MSVGREEAPVWTWYFASPKELQDALGEYTALQEGTAIRKYGHDGLRVLVDDWGNDVLDDNGHPVLVFDPEPLRDPESGAKTEFDKARIRSEIDACMDRIRTRYPHWWWLLDVYYRQGRSLEPRGWIVTATLLGVHRSKCPPLMRCPVSPGDNRSDWEDCQRHDKYHCFWNHDTFRRQLGCAVARLFDAHRGRSEPTH